MTPPPNDIVFKIGDPVYFTYGQSRIKGKIIDYIPSDDDPYAILGEDGVEYKGPFNALTRDRYKEVDDLDLENTVYSSRTQSHRQPGPRPVQRAACSP